MTPYFRFPYADNNGRQYGAAYAQKWLPHQPTANQSFVECKNKKAALAHTEAEKLAKDYMSGIFGVI